MSAGGAGRTIDDTPARQFGTMRRKEAEVLTAKLTAIPSEFGNC